MKFLKWTGIVLLILIVLYFLGPKPAHPRYNEDVPVVPADPVQLEAYVHAEESKHKLKTDNEARIIWNDSARSKTPYSFVYLHGFSASQEEGDPVHSQLARTFGGNLFLARIASHGIDTTEPLLSFTVDKAWHSAKEALAIGKQLGNKVIIVATSTGGTLALKLAAEYPEIAGLLLLSPNIAINDPLAWLVNNPWGLQLAHAVKGPYKISSDSSAMYKQYWYNRYRMEAVVQLQELIESSMKASTFEKITQPVLVLYYYKDDDHQDDVVKVSAMKRMYMQLGTPEHLKRMVAVPSAGDHVIGSHITSKDFQSVSLECEKFCTEILRIQKTQ